MKRRKKWFSRIGTLALALLFFFFFPFSFFFLVHFRSPTPTRTPSHFFFFTRQTTKRTLQALCYVMIRTIIIRKMDFFFCIIIFLLFVSFIARLPRLPPHTFPIQSPYMHTLIQSFVFLQVFVLKVFVPDMYLYSVLKLLFKKELKRFSDSY